MAGTKEDYWHSGKVGYQIYPRSFNASGDESMGTLRGIIDKLDYLKNVLGVDFFWLSPFYKSSDADGGYDVVTYREPEEVFGTVADLEELIDKAHKIGLRVMVDFIPNHMSSDSDWYTEASSSRDNPKADWFYFRDPKPKKEGGPYPNNWLSEFRELQFDAEGKVTSRKARSVWQWVEARQQYVLCTYTPQQVDLNWHNKKLREAVYDEMRFLLDLGVDGFRMDAVKDIGKPEDLTDDPENPDYDPKISTDGNDRIFRVNSRDNDVMFDFMRGMVDVLKEYDNKKTGDHKFIVFEDYVSRDNPIARYRRYFEQLDPKYCSLFDFEWFEHMMEPTAKNRKTYYDELWSLLAEGEVLFPTFENHDNPRYTTRHNELIARRDAVLLLTSPGSPIIFQGQEAGLEDVIVPPDQIQDPFGGRDGVRSPIPWDASKNAGFTAGKPWLPITPKFKKVNIAAQLKDPNSYLNLYRKLLAIRRESTALRRGAHVPQDPGHEHIEAHMYVHEGERIITVASHLDKKITVSLPNQNKKGWLLLSSMSPDASGEIDINKITLQPKEALVISLE